MISNVYIANNQVFLDFLAQLRKCYLERDKAAIFHSVILAGVYDIKNLKLKLRPQSEHQYNSPWNTRKDNEENVRLHTFDECTWDYRELAPYNIAADFDGGAEGFMKYVSEHYSYIEAQLWDDDVVLQNRLFA